MLLIAFTILESEKITGNVYSRNGRVRNTNNLEHVYYIPCRTKILMLCFMNELLKKGFVSTGNF